MKKPAQHRVLYGGVVAQRGENVVDQSTVGVDVSRIVRDNPRNSMPVGELDQCRSECCLASAGVMETHFNSESIAKNFAPLVERACGGGVIARLNARGDRTRCWTSEHMHSRTSLSQIFPAHTWPSTQLCVLSFLPVM